MKNFLLTACSVAVLAAVLSQDALAQGTTSAIRGKVLGANGQPVDNASVVIRDTRTGAVRTLESNDSGAFLASNLSVGGPYEVTVNGTKKVMVDSISLGDIYSLNIELGSQPQIEEVVVVGEALQMMDVAAGPAATFSSFEMQTAVALERDIKDVYSIDPRLNIDDPEDGAQLNCVGKHPRFNSTTLDGVSVNDRFGLNNNGYATATGQSFPFDSISQVAVELAPFDVSYGGFSACNINAVTRSGSNQWEGNLWYEWTSNDLRGDSLDTGSGTINITGEAYDERQKGFSLGGPILSDRLFFYTAYEETESPEFIAMGYAGSGNGEQRDWLPEADYQRVIDIANNVYGYDPGGQPGNGAATQEKLLFKLDWEINEMHSASFVYNSYEGVEDRGSDDDSDEFEFANHYYQKGADLDSYTLMLRSQWSDSFSTELFYNESEMLDLQQTVGPTDFADIQIDYDSPIDGSSNTIYLGADDSRQANQLGYSSELFKLNGQFLAGDHVISGGYEQEKLSVFNQFVQHARGGEIDFDSIDDFENGTFRTYYYGSGGGSNDPNDATAGFANTLHTLYLQDEYVFYDLDLTLTGGLRYEWFAMDDTPVRNVNFEALYGGLRNDSNIDGLDLLMPRLGFVWEAEDNLTVRGGLGLYSGGNPNVWFTNAWSNDGVSSVQPRLNGDGTDTILQGLPGSIDLIGNANPGRDVPQALFDEVAAVNPDLGDGSTRRIIFIDPDYKQPNELKMALGATYDFSNGWSVDTDLLWSELRDGAIYYDISQEQVGSTILGQPIYDYVDGEDNLVLSNTPHNSQSLSFSVVGRKTYDFGLDLVLGYAYTDAEDVNAMQSFTAQSNFDNVSLLDINDPQPATSNYNTPHRFTLRASYGHEFFDGYETRFTTYIVRKDGQPQSYVMDGQNLEGDGFFGRHLLYVPADASDPNVDLSGMTAAQQNEFFGWADARDLDRGAFVSRNESYSPWTTRMDVRVDQELPGFFGDSKGRVYFKVYNFLNLVNDSWGLQYDADFFANEVINADIDAQGRYVYSNFRDGDITGLRQSASLWEARLGIEFEF
ncbi:MAG: carboxypeptidase regulatory-like domain-containing protein [Ketobacter sp.]